ncbi:MAG: prephenate dehydrogenase/arogenate dehydrogenase family protein [Planctomycetota bacterium]
MPDDHFHTDHLVIIGSGMLGTSVAMGLKSRGFTGRITALCRSLASCEKAQATGAYDMATDDPAAALRDATLALIAVPLSGFRTVFSQIAEHGPSDLIITDVGSTKSSVIADAKATMRDLSRVIGAHPMAGSEQSGPESGNPDLFIGKPCILTLSETDDPAAVDLVQGLWQKLGMSILTMSPREHDEKAAVVSHLPHLAAVMLVQVAEQLGGLDLASTGYRDTTRLASSNPPMRTDILMANRKSVDQALEALQSCLAELRRVLQAGDPEAIHLVLEKAQASRERWLQQQRNIP